MGMRQRIDKYLNLIGKFVRLDVKYYIRNSTYLIASQVVSMAFGVVLSIVFVRVLNQETYGHWNFILSVGGLVSILTLTGMNTAIIQAVARGHGRALLSATKKRFKWSVTGSIVLLGIGIYYYLNESTAVGEGIMISSLFFPFFEVLKGYTSYLSGKKQFGKVAKYGIITQAVSIPATIAAVYLSRNLLVIVVVYLCTITITRGWFFRLVSHDIGKATDDEGTIPFGKRLTLVDIPGLISTYGDKLIIGITLSFTDLAVYSIALGASNFLRYVVDPIASVSLPKLAAMPEKDAYTAVKQRYVYVFLLMLVTGGFCMWLYQYLIPFLYTEQYSGAIFYSQILIGSLIFGVPNMLLTKALFPAQRKSREILHFEVIRVIVRTILLVILTLKFGLIGVPITVLVTSMITMVYSWKLAGWI
jgi:O-antigen/teichoic acid export membrane protein